jgi:hypothetical protein
VVAKMTQLHCSQLHVQILTTPMSQPEARKFCTNRGWKLAKVDEEWKFDAIQTLIRDCPGKVFFFQYYDFFGHRLFFSMTSDTP